MNFADVLILIQVVEKTRLYPKLKSIHDAAMAELEAIANPPKEEEEPEPEVVDEAQDIPEDKDAA